MLWLQAAAEAESQHRKERFHPAFTRLVALIRGRVRYPDNYDSLHKDEKREFKNSRYMIADTIVDAAREPLSKGSPVNRPKIALCSSGLPACQQQEEGTLPTKDRPSQRTYQDGEFRIGQCIIFWKPTDPVKPAAYQEATVSTLAGKASRRQRAKAWGVVQMCWARTGRSSF